MVDLGHLAASVSFQLIGCTISVFPFLRVGMCTLPSEEGKRPPKNLNDRENETNQLLEVPSWENQVSNVGEGVRRNI